jgi:hypothetical protein
MRLLMIIFLAILFSGSAQAQCRIGSGPDQGDGIPWCAQTPTAPFSPPEPELPAQWVNFAAAVAWADSDMGSQFVGVAKQIDEQMARDTVLQKCRDAGWENCSVATSVTNGVIVVARDANRALRTRIAATEREARDGLKAKCREAEVSCQILAVFDGSAEYY